jgi:hypothetical protein
MMDNQKDKKFEENPRQLGPVRILIVAQGYTHEVLSQRAKSNKKDIYIC